MRICKNVLAFVLSALLVFCTTAGMSLTSYALEERVQSTESFIAAEPEAAEAETVTVKVINCDNALTIGYKETKSFEFETENLPRDAAVHVFCNGEDMGETTYYSVYSPTEDYTVEAKVLDPDGKVLAASGEIKVTVKNGFFDRLSFSIKKGFRTFGDAVMDIFGAIFMRIWIFLHR